MRAAFQRFTKWDFAVIAFFLYAAFDGNSKLISILCVIAGFLWMMVKRGFEDARESVMRPRIPRSNLVGRTSMLFMLSSSPVNAIT
jgi:hypothetical protein